MNIIERLKFALGSNLYIHENILIKINPNQKKINKQTSLFFIVIGFTLIAYLISEDKNVFYFKSFIFWSILFNSTFFLYDYILVPNLIGKYFFANYYKYVFLQVLGIVINSFILLIIFYLKIIEIPPKLYELSFNFIFLFCVLMSSSISNWTIIIYINDIFISAISNNNINLLEKNENEIIINQQQINPHFLANSLSNLQAMIRVGKYEQALKFNSELVSLFTQQMMYSNKSVITIEDEINWLKSYLDVEKERILDNIQYSIVVKNDNLLFYELPPLLLQPIVENSIQHGYMPHLEKIFKLDIVIEEIENNGFRIEINDNGIGNTETRTIKKSGHSLALKNIKNRIDLINTIGKFKINYFHKLGAEGSNTQIIITTNSILAKS